MEIAGSTALVTGASRRIGRALALALAQSGCNVAVHYRSDAAAALETREQARDFGIDCEVVQADLAVAGECDRLWFATVEKMGDVPNIIINNASHFDRTDLPSLTSQDFDLAMSVNVRAPLASRSGHATRSRRQRQNPQHQRPTQGLSDPALHTPSQIPR